MTVSYNQNGVLTLGNTNLKTLAQSFGTPTIVYDEMYIRQQMRRYHQAFQKKWMLILCCHMRRRHLRVSKWSS